MDRALTTLAIAVLALSACELSMVGKNRCRTSADCLDAFECRDGICADRSSCARPCGAQCCGNGQTCDPNRGVCLGTCRPSCTGRQCGYDGCPGGSCGECGLGFRCADGTCELCTVPDCAGKECGPDGCGRQCGTCSSGYVCNWESLCERSTAADGGTVLQPDSGVASHDAGTGPLDAGPLASDAGGEEQDSGALGWDAGPGSDAGSAPDAGSGSDAQPIPDAS